MKDTYQPAEAQDYLMNEDLIISHLKPVAVATGTEETVTDS